MDKYIKATGLLILLVLYPLLPSVAAQRFEGDRIIGKWVSEQKNLVVEVYKAGVTYNAKIVWFNDRDDLSRPMATRTDLNNTDPALKNRKLLGMDVLKMLTYNEGSSSWENGIIYDSRNGKDWNSCAYLTKSGLLCVKGYWHFKFIGRTANFERVNAN